MFPFVFLLGAAFCLPLQFPNLFSAIMAGNVVTLPSIVIPLSRLGQVLLALLLPLSAGAFGVLMLRKSLSGMFQTNVERLVVASTIGLLPLILLTFLAAILGLLNPALWFLLIAVLVVNARQLGVIVTGAWKELRQYFKEEAQHWGIIFFALVTTVAAIHLLLILVSHCYPTTETDTVNYHLYPVRVYAESGAWQSLPDNPNFYPEGMEMLYTLGYLLGSQFTARGIHLLFVLLLFLLIVIAIRRFDLAPAAVAVIASFLSVPIVSYVVGDSLSNDLPVAYFLLFSLVFLISKDGKLSFGWISALGLGLALASKHTAILAFPFFLVLLARRILASGRNERKAELGVAIPFLITAFLCGLPWYAKSFIQTGNPLWPTFSSWFSGPYNEYGAELMRVTKSNYGIWEVSQLYRIPYEMFFGDGVKLDGTFGPIPLLLLVPLFFSRRDSSFARIVLTFIALSLLSWLLVVQEVRYLIFALPSLLLLGFSAFAELTKTPEVGASLWYRRLCLSVVGLTLILSLPFFEAAQHDPQRYTPLLQRRFLTSREASFGVSIGNRDADYLRSKLPSYRLVEWINSETPETSRVFFMGSEPPWLYMQRELLWDQRSLVLREHRRAKTLEDFLTVLRAHNITHIFFRRSQFPTHWLSDLEVTWNSSELELLRVENDYYLYRVIPAGEDQGPRGTLVALLQHVHAGDELRPKTKGDVLLNFLAEVNDRSRNSLVLLGSAVQEWEVTVPEGARLVFGLTKMFPGRGDGGVVRVIVSNGGAERNIFEKNLSSEVSNEGWEDVEVDLGEFAGTTITLRFESSTGDRGDAEADWFAISEPMLIGRSSAE
jgi:hypothetical protein